ncbi:MAG: hypothetical protein ABIF09_08280 [Gemmatimonadota bacterium]
MPEDKGKGALVAVGLTLAAAGVGTAVWYFTREKPEKPPPEGAPAGELSSVAVAAL